MLENILLPDMVNSIVNRIHIAGGKAMLVGGGIIDIIRDRKPKDWDIEVFGISFLKLEQIFSDKGCKLVGQEFGILKLAAEKCDGLDVDLSIPRKDNHTGKGHADLMVELDPSMTIEDACRRRDFTINSMALDLLTGKLHDPFNGMQDLRNGILRATDPELFIQDPLRALRAMQLLARKCGPNGTVEPRTMSLIRSMCDLFPNLARERVYGEFRKLLMKAEVPSVGLLFLRESGWLGHFPELERLINCEQNPEWHPEGDVWIHSLHTVDSAAWVRDNGNIPDEWLEAFMFGTLCHDIGKPDTTVTPAMVDEGTFPKERLWSAWGHDKAGMPLVNSFLQRMTNNKDLIEKVTSIVSEHMQPWNLFQGNASKASWKRLHNRIRLDVIGWMCRCDSCGGPDISISNPDLEHKTSQLCWDYFSEFGEKPIRPILMGRHLISAGLKPSREFTTMLDAAYTVQLNNDKLSVAELLEVATNSISK